MAQMGVEQSAEWSENAATAASAGDMDMDQMTPARLVEEASSEFQSDNLARLRTWSIVAGVGLAIISGAGGFIFSGMILRPIRNVTQVASEVSATNLSLRINHEGPEDELKDLADTFDSMIERIERGFEAQRRFVLDASHELRTPLASIRTNIEVAEMELESGNEVRDPLLETIKGQMERLTRLSEDLLLLTTPQATLPLARLAPSELVPVALDELAPLAERSGVTLVSGPQGDCEALANPDMLYRCLSNLVDNAIKYSDEGAVTTVSSGCEDEGVWISVRDTGPGIPAEHIEHVFERFYLVDSSRARERGGSGLGLAIVRELMASMDGAVEVESREGAGSTFTLRLAHAPAAEGAAQHGTGVSAP